MGFLNNFVVNGYFSLNRSGYSQSGLNNNPGLGAASNIAHPFVSGTVIDPSFEVVQPGQDKYWAVNDSIISSQLFEHPKYISASQLSQSWVLDIDKAMAHQEWSSADMAQASSFGVVVLGGSIGTQGRFGQPLLTAVQQSFDGPVIQSPDPVAAALMGAVSII